MAIKADFLQKILELLTIVVTDALGLFMWSEILENSFLKFRNFYTPKVILIFYKISFNLLVVKEKAKQFIAKF